MKLKTAFFFLAIVALALAPLPAHGQARYFGNVNTATSTAAAATLNSAVGSITTEALTTAALTNYTFTLTNSRISAGNILLVSVANGTNNGGTPVVANVTPGAGSAVIVIRNAHATTAFNGTIKIMFLTYGQ